MRRMNWLQDASLQKFMTPRHIQESLTESDILYLQDVFLTNGCHHIKLKNVAAGRRIVHTFLGSLLTYHDIASLSTAKQTLKPEVFDIYSVLSEGGYLDPMSPYDLDEFFIEEFYFDFMWIEATHNLLTSTWFQDFEGKIEDFKINQHIPMVMISYQDC